MQLKSHLQDVQERVRALLKARIAELEGHAPRLKNAMEYSLLMGGKQMRPLLAYSTGDMLGIKREYIDPVALAVECIHAYSLVHDDLPAMDDDALRRGQPTCHIAFDEATAILAGDALQTLAFDILATYPLPCDLETQRILWVRQLSGAAGYTGMCGGQAMDLAATNASVSQTELEALHRRKTGALLKVSLTMALSAATDVQDDHRQALLTYADSIGLAFQVQDDILDIVGDSSTLGKPQGSDQALNKSTYPALLGLEGAQKYLAQLHQQALQALAALPYNTQVLQSVADYIVQRNH